MERDHIRCRNCGGINDRGSRFCWYCGSELPHYGSPVRAAGWGMLKTFKWLFVVVALLAPLAGVYYAMDYFVDAAVGQSTNETASATTSILPSTTTTTTEPLVPRSVPGGADRYATAIAISQFAFPEGAPAVVLVPGDQLGGSLAAVSLAGAYEASILLLPPDGLTSGIGAEIQRLAPSDIFLVNSPRASRVTQTLKDLVENLTVTRITGEDPFDTAAVIAEHIKAKLGTIQKVVLAPVGSLVEGLTVAPLAAMNGWPILFSDGGQLPGATSAAIEQLGAASAVVVGSRVEPALDDVDTLTSPDAFDTAADIAAYAADEGASFAHTVIVSGDSFPDGLVTAAYVAKSEGVILPAKGGRLPPAVALLLQDERESIEKLEVIGLPGVAESLAPSTTTTQTTGPGPSTGST